MKTRLLLFLAILFPFVSRAVFVEQLAAGSDIVAKVNASPTNAVILLGPGVFNITNCVFLKGGQTLKGSGMGVTIVQWWGYTVDAVQTLGDSWVGIAVSNNVVVSDMTITNMISSNNVFQACIGRGTNAGNVTVVTNFLIERVSMYGDTDNLYIDNGGTYSGIISDCFFDSRWDAFVLNLRENSNIQLINPYFNCHGPATGKSGVLALATPIRVSNSGNATNRALTVIGGFMRSTGPITATANNGLPTAWYGTRFIGTNNGAWFYGNNQFFGCPDVTYTNIVSGTGGQEGNTAVIYPGLGQNNAAEEALWGNAAVGASYYDTNRGALRLFDGYSWRSLATGANSNQVHVTGASTAAYNGVYAWKSGRIGSSFFSYTNLSGKFFVGSTNAEADAPFAISDTESISNGTEFVLNVNVFPERGWDEPDIRLTRIVAPNSDFVLSGATAVTNGYYIGAAEKTLTESSATAVVNVTVHTNKGVSIRVFATTRANDAADYQRRNDSFVVTAVNKAGTVTAAISTIGTGDTSAALSSGTLATTWTAVANGNSVDIKNSAVSSLTQTTLACKWRVEVDSDHTPVITPQ